MRVFDVTKFRRTILSERPDFGAISAVLTDHRLMLGAVLETMVERFERDPGYGFIDMKLSLLDGRDFDPADPIRGKGTIYGWIQGRGLEALAGHYRWLQRNQDIEPADRQAMLRRLQAMLRTVLDKMETLRAAQGRLYFMSDTQGHPLAVGPQGHPVPHSIPADAPPTSTDMFYVKGLMAAAEALDDQTRMRQACVWFEHIVQCVTQDRFLGDQQPLDPKNVGARTVAGRYGHGTRMLGLGALAVFMEITGERKWLDVGFDFLDHILRWHVNTTGDNAQSRQYDMWEFTDAQHRPWLENGQLFSDSGHGTEMVGLAMKFLRAAHARGLVQPDDKARIAEYYRVLPLVLRRNFANGFAGETGIVKTFDLVSRKPVNSDMPWWSLPETMRAAMACAAIQPENARGPYLDIARKCSNAFFAHYLRPDLLAYQTLDAAGKPVPVVPATPDADPGYHTGLSIIDTLALAEDLLRQAME